MRVKSQWKIHDRGSCLKLFCVVLLYIKLGVVAQETRVLSSFMGAAFTSQYHRKMEVQKIVCHSCFSGACLHVCMILRILLLDESIE